MKKISAVYSLFIILYFTTALPTLAVVFANPIKYGTIPQVINAIINFIMIVSIPLLAGVVIYGGLLMITSSGEPEKFNNGWKTILFAVVGFIVILLAKGIALAVNNFFR